MKYLQKQKYAELRNRYAVIIGWGAGLEFQKYFDHAVLAFDYMIDGANRNVGKQINGIAIQGIDAIEQLKDMNSVLVVIYPNIESEILRQVSKLLPHADTIVARLLDIEGRKSTYSADREDLLILDYLHSQYTDFTYMDIGVCHPVVRNNTYLFYEGGFTNGVLVEPNAEMCSLAKEYRPLNKIVNVGASPTFTKEKLTYYYDPIHPGLNTFLKEVAVSRGMDKNFQMIPMKDINTIIAENFETYPNVLDIDTEGLDLELLSHLDFEKYPIDVICVESFAGEGIRNLMREKGYRLLAETQENEIYAAR